LGLKLFDGSITKGKKIGLVLAKLVSISTISKLDLDELISPVKGKRQARRRCPFAICSGSFERRGSRSQNHT
jgi:hypothetical protein